MNRLSAPLLAALLSLAGCVVEPPGPSEHSSAVIERDSTETLRATLKMGAGNLRLGSGTEKLVRADFDYNIPSWKPEVRYSKGDFTISQPSSHTTHLGSHRYEWDVRFNREVPLDLRVEFGAGDARMDLGNLALRRVDVQMGVGTVRMDLRGPVSHDYDVRIQGGVGEATIYLPADAAIDAEASGGIGEIKATGLRKEGSHYYNEAYGKAKYTIRLNVQGGVGSIHLISD